jgi:DNA-binding response OmpR family regulator
VWAEVVVKRKILVIGDDPASQDLLCDTFPTDEFQVFPASSRMNVVFQLCLVQPDLIVLDTLQPGRDREALSQIRERSFVPIIVLNALAEHETKLESLRYGADDFMPKPFSTRELQARVRALLRRSQYCFA